MSILSDFINSCKVSLSKSDGTQVDAKRRKRPLHFRTGDDITMTPPVFINRQQFRGQSEEKEAKLHWCKVFPKRISGPTAPLLQCNDRTRPLIWPARSDFICKRWSQPAAAAQLWIPTSLLLSLGMIVPVHSNLLILQCPWYSWVLCFVLLFFSSSSSCSSTSPFFFFLKGTFAQQINITMPLLTFADDEDVPQPTVLMKINPRTDPE